MREIKFRVWNKETSKMTDWTTIRKYRNFEKLISLKHVALMQYTGLKDKNGVEIYEGDIISDGDFNIVVKFGKYDSEFNESVYGYYGETTCENTIYDATAFDIGEAIGNIYENKELLNEL